jgi:glycosyltransferase involved in cell wall biosynthesis
MRILMLTHYPPMRGGISAYADQAVARLREQGHDVEVASPEPSDAQHVIDVRARGAGAKLARLARSCDRLIVQFQPEMLGSPDSTLLMRSRSLLRLARGLRAAPSAELCIHEVNYGAGPTAPLQRRLVRPIWNLAEQVMVHTERERRDFASGFGVSADRIRVVSQGEHMVRRTDTDRERARAALGLPTDKVILLAIGFLQPNKGFDRAIDAFAQVPHDDARLFVVGSTWREDPSSRRHVDELRRLAAATPRTELREGYLDDEGFDRWIVASDVLVLPYRFGWSSNVMARGLLYDRPVIMSRAGGMAEQGTDRPGVTLVEDDAALVEAIRAVIADVAPESANRMQ